MEKATLLAAVDLGSNSFRLEIGRWADGRIHCVESLKETVRQGGALDESHRLTHEAMERGWDCLARFARRLREVPAAQVRAVATQTLREARNSEQFLARARDVLGHPIEVISGTEEARLIYQGVTRLLPVSAERRLVVDIGGRSTEIILGRGHRPEVAHSLPIGSVSWSLKHFPHGQLTRAAFEHAQAEAGAVLAPVLGSYPRHAWERAWGSSGTVGAVAEAVAACGRNGSRLRREDLHALRSRLLELGSVERVNFKGIGADRRPLIGGGLSVLIAVCEALRIDELSPAQGALRHGLLYELVGEPEQAA